MEEVKEALNIVGDIMGTYLPLIQSATIVINDIIKICEAAEYNQNICNSLLDRVKLTSTAIDSLKRRKQKNENKLRNEVYYQAFHKFIYVLNEIETYTADISKIHGFWKYKKADSVKEKFMQISIDYDKSMNDLHFTIAVANEEQKKIDEEALAEDLADFDKFLKTIDRKTDDLHEIKYIKNHTIEKSLHNVNKINPIYLSLPLRRTHDDVRRGSNFVIKRIFKGQEVACKKSLMNDKEIKSSPEVRRLIMILIKLSNCNHILKFYGVSKIGIDNVMIFEWAERGTLRELYEKKNISWHFKVRIALNICRGLVFLQQAEILHHNLKCGNILMTQTLEPKIYNFELARFDSGYSISIGSEIHDAIRWIAPEKLSNFSRYTTWCEIFSFSMLLWELAFEKVPYRNWTLEKIMAHVTKGGRETIKFEKSTPEISILQEGYKRIINDAWKQIPHERKPLLKILDMLEELHKSISYMFDDNLQELFPDKVLDLDKLNEVNNDLDMQDDVVSDLAKKFSRRRSKFSANNIQPKKIHVDFEYFIDSTSTIFG
ncbi:kinase-like domain-containing protein [Rhizophagus irregularis DAOM 181602=DAOM 197198]|uniref:Kinase-like domain-containing protein n=1 Tax=Rhizophagus irregularis (strain DAOM 181602 / DAOM 197198 / MUCL 43194) TaxID=747089 RepID=A0A2P4QZI2_RHIID|nr:kinase-like domain-containing protein [Rhizophagus irregularis DAOM 181602=DAOM 197198]POG83073.1 kinase-like domain-containing protein [Rhizophagus irregularis DAOM 181602=DAOM 197198]|eukprot:XP_025189939.1 kinase-like domain-containing protein [Rhizophagus irregularis DAOM 181602=DAOM 197198]